MNCAEALELLSGHVDAVNTPEEEAQLQAHLASCPACRAILTAYEEADRGLSALQTEPPAALVQGVMNAIRSETAAGKKVRRFPLRGFAATAVAAALLLAVGITYLPRLTSTEHAAVPDAAVYTADASAGDSSALSKALLPEEAAGTDEEPSADTAADPQAMDPAAAADAESVTVPTQTEPMTITAQATDGQDSAETGSETPVPNAMTVNPSAVTTDASSDAVLAAFPDGQEIPELLVELTDNPSTPAAVNITELSQLTAEETADDGIVFYECTAGTVRNIISSYEAVYTFEAPVQLDAAADTDTCGLLVIQP